MRLYPISILLIACLTLPVKSQSSAPAPPISRTQLYRALIANKALNLDRRLIHLTHVCDLRVEGQWLPVVDVQELVKGENVAHGVNYIIILNRALKTLHTIEYLEERPLFCLGNQLWVDGDLPVSRVYPEGPVTKVNPEGNVLTFKSRGLEISLDHIELNDVPIPPTRNRRQIQ